MAPREETARHISVIQMLLDSEKQNAELQQTINELQRRPTVESPQVLQQQNKELQQTVNELQSQPTVDRPRIEVDLTVDDSDPLSETGLDGDGISGHDTGLDERDDGGSVDLRDRQPHPNRKKRRFNNEESMPSVLLDTEDTAPASQATTDSTVRRSRRTKPTQKTRKGPKRNTDEVPVPELFLFMSNDGGDDDEDDETTGALRPASELPAAALSSIQNAYEGLFNGRTKQVDPRTMMAEKHRGTYVDQGVCIARYFSQGSRAKACPSNVTCKNCIRAGQRPCVRLETHPSEEKTIAVFHARPEALRGTAVWKDHQFWLDA
jgi:hypothetical protein